MEIFFQLSTHTISLVALYAILAIGFNLNYSVNRFFDMTYAGYCVLGAYTFLFARTIGQGSFGAMLMTMIFVGVISYLIETFLFSKLRTKKTSSLVMFIASLGVLTVVQGIVSLLFTTNIQTIPSWQNTLQLNDITISYVQILTVTTAVLIYIVVTYFLKVTKLGIQLRAVSDNPELAQTSGVPVKKIRIFTNIVSANIAAIAGILYGMDININPLMGIDLFFKGVISAITGGLGSIVYGFSGAIVLAIAENSAVWFISGIWKDLTAFTLLILILTIRPRGILKK